MKDINKENYLQKLFIDEAKASFSRFSGGNFEEQIAAVNEQLAALEGRVTALEPLYNYFDMSVFRNETSDTLSVRGNSGQPSAIQVDSNGFTTIQPFSAFCPKAKVGQTYTMTVYAAGYWDSPGGGGADVYLVAGNNHYTFWYAPNWSGENLDSGGATICTFTLTKEMLDAHIVFNITEAMDYADEDGDGMWENVWYPRSELFYYFQMSEGEEPKPYKPYKG